MRKNAEGYTLVELLIALAVFSALAASFAVALRQGFHSWKMQREDQLRRQEARVVLNRLARDLRNAVPLAKESFIGSEREIIFHRPEENGIVRVQYRLSENHGNTVLERRHQFLSREGNGTPVRRATISSSMKVHWEFAAKSPENGEIIWRRKWTDGDGFPLGMRVRLELPSADGRAPPVVYQRILDFPLGGT